jgi:DNA-directed RNA polymerase subunit RPC12/RpoP
MENKIEPIIVEKRVVPIYKNIHCPHCNSSMVGGNFNVLIFPPIMNYICPKCGYVYESSKSYPTIEWYVEENGTLGEQIYV